MSKAFKCNYCDTFFDGDCMVQSKAIGIKYAPENNEAPFHVQDICEDCFPVWVAKHKEGQEMQKEKRRKERVCHATKES